MLALVGIDFKGRKKHQSSTFIRYQAESRIIRETVVELPMLRDHYHVSVSASADALKLSKRYCNANL